MKKPEHKEFDDAFADAFFKEVGAVIKKHGYDAWESIYGFDRETKTIHFEARVLTKEEREESESGINCVPGLDL